MKRSNVLLAGAVIGAVGYAAFLRPRSMRWGATWRERSRIWAGLLGRAAKLRLKLSK